MGKASRNKSRSSNDGSKGIPVAVFVGLALVVFVVIAVVVSNHTSTKKSANGGTTSTTIGACTKYDARSPLSQDVSSPAEQQAIDVQGSALPAFSDTADKTISAYCQPTITGFDFNGKEIAITQDGKPKLIMFVAHWCPHCQREVPIISDYLGANPQTNVELYAVATGTDSTRDNYPPSAWLKRVGWPVQTIADSDRSRAADTFGLTSYPYFVVVGRNGHIIKRTSGELSIDDFKALLASAQSS